MWRGEPFEALCMEKVEIEKGALPVSDGGKTYISRARKPRRRILANNFKLSIQQLCLLVLPSIC